MLVFLVLGFCGGGYVFCLVVKGSNNSQFMLKWWCLCIWFRFYFLQSVCVFACVSFFAVCSIFYVNDASLVRLTPPWSQVTRIIFTSYILLMCFYCLDLWGLLLRTISGSLLCCCLCVVLCWSEPRPVPWCHLVPLYKSAWRSDAVHSILFLISQTLSLCFFSSVGQEASGCWAVSCSRWM